MRNLCAFILFFFFSSFSQCRHWNSVVIVRSEILFLFCILVAILPTCFVLVGSFVVPLFLIYFTLFKHCLILDVLGVVPRGVLDLVNPSRNSWIVQSLVVFDENKFQLPSGFVM